MIAEHAQCKTIIIGGRPSMEGWTAAYHATGIRPRTARLTDSAKDGPMTAIIYFGEILVASLLAIVLLALSQLRMSFDAVLFAGGVVALTLAEYLVHRFVLHGFAPIAHRLHHANPDGAVLTIFWQIWICFALVYLIVGGAFVAGALVAYAWYLFVHHCAHHGPDSLPLSLLKHHQSHHRFASRNYGVSTTLWDHVFGTMLR
jgi:sterol desaturase/sphingolipid hydroxylase (fatty acid hydroxylase superfamily)